ncbi:MAG TPA: cyclic nucleotide-binding domain-containing protein [Longimicrobium sp.]|jgi:predicted acylesterase/phospholipase RssA/CRP-like cAMP-binding protein
MTHDASTLPDPIRSDALWSALAPDVARALAAAASTVALGEGEALFGPGQPTQALYFVLDGRLRAADRAPGAPEVTVRTFEAGEALDEMQVLAGTGGPLALVADSPVRLACVEGHDADRLVAEFPEIREARDRVRHRQLLCRLHGVFGAFDRALLDDVEATAGWLHRARGELLFEQGTHAGELYFVLSGRVRIVAFGVDDLPRVLGEAGPGESIGEAAFFGSDRRPERVEAVRDSVLVGFTPAEFDALSTRRPGLLRAVAFRLAERLHRPPASGPPRVSAVAILPATPGAPVREFVERLARALAPHGSVLRLDAAEVEARMAEPGIAQAWESDEVAHLLAWLEGQETANRFVLYEADERPTAWTRRCLRRADRVLLVADARADPKLGDLERSLAAADDGRLPAPRTLILVHPDGSTAPSKTRDWLADRGVDGHQHLRWDRDGDFGRVARLLAGRTVGVVLGGGGARGLAHVGMLRAMDEAGIPIDLIGGTSMGALVAAQYAQGFDAARIVETKRHVYLKMAPQKGWTLPVLSLVGTRLPEITGKQVHGDLEVEDLWTPFFCVSSDLTAAEMVVHREGLVRRVVLASSSLPAFAVPVLHGNHLLVDGGLVNNVPVDVARQLGCGTVFAAEVSIESDEGFTCERVPSVWEVLRARFMGGARVRFPSLLEVAMRATVLQATYRQRVTLLDADFAFRPPIERFGMMDFPRLDEIVEAGYEHARQAIAGWREAGRLDALLGPRAAPSPTLPSPTP